MDFEDSYCPEPNSGCWLWMGAYRRDGYGVAKRAGAHRYSYELHVGPIPSGLCVLHKCDTPPCVNPDHLFLGTRADNNADMDVKRRRGTRRGKKLTESDVLEIRAAYKPWQRGSSQRALARRFGISHAQIAYVLNRRDWGWLIDGPLASAHRRIWFALPRRAAS